MNATHDPALKSWVEYGPESPFPIQNLPFGVYRAMDSARPAVCTAIGEWILDLAAVHEAGMFDGTPLAQQNVFAAPTLNPFMALGPTAWSAARARLSQLLSADNKRLRNDAKLLCGALRRQGEVRMSLPVDIRDYTDFYSSREHATNLGAMFRDPANALLPNWLHLPVGYHGRSSSIVLSGTDIRRPCGQTKADDAAAPSFGPSKAMDFELELAFFVGPPSALGRPITTAQAPSHIFGFALFNDWSARDIQKWEYVPLGPFLGKNFGSSLAPWIVTVEALEPFRVAGPVQDPQPLPYLRYEGNWSFDIQLEVALKSASMTEPVTISRTNARHLYWNALQQLAHHTANGCNVRTGDCMASGTISGPTPDSLGSMIELAWKGTRPLALPTGEERRFLMDGDTVTLRGWCQGEGYRVGLGEVSGTILPAAGE